MGTNAAFEQSEATAEETYTFGDATTGSLFDADTVIAPPTTSGATVASLFEDELTSTALSNSVSDQTAGSNNIFDAPPSETTSNPFGEETAPVASVPDVVPSVEASIFGGSTASAGSGTSTGNVAASNPFSVLDVLADSLPATATATSTQQNPQQEDNGLIGIINDK